VTFWQGSTPPARPPTRTCRASGCTPVKGDLKGSWAATVRANWRVIFRLAEGDAQDLDYVDYH
jgi:proteic killer suppression protein